MRILSLLCSICLHLAIICLITSQKITPKINLDQKVQYKVKIVTLKKHIKKGPSNKPIKSKKAHKITPKKIQKIKKREPITPLKPKKKEPIKIAEKKRNIAKNKKVDLKKEREKEIKSALSEIFKIAKQEEKQKEIVSKEILEISKNVSKEDTFDFEMSKEDSLENYKKIVEAMIQQNFRYLSINPNLSVKIEVLIDKDGVITNKKIVHSSGDKFFDNMALKAIDETGSLEPPPTKEKLRFIITLGNKE